VGSVTVAQVALQPVGGEDGQVADRLDAERVQLARRLGADAPEPFDG
jgi:hypothetical protein